MNPLIPIASASSSFNLFRDKRFGVDNLGNIGEMGSDKYDLSLGDTHPSSAVFFLVVSSSVGGLPSLLTVTSPRSARSTAS